MQKQLHEIRDPIHVFVRLDSDERRVLDSRPFQRLRHIHQLGLTYLVYPGATHRRFEHSLGVMELASRVYDVVTDPRNLLRDSVRDLVPHQDSLGMNYWRRALRMAALCHDLGHLPFSHAAEEALLPDGWNHERLTVELVFSEGLGRVWSDLKLQPDDVAKLAVGPRKYCKYRKEPFSVWEAVLAEIVVGDAFGVDRMDYLLRDSHHAGVAYGRFDHHRLIDTLRILPKSDGGSTEPALGVEEGGLQSAEASLLARYFMFTQLYFHPVRRIYDIHLKDFLAEVLPGGKFPTSLPGHLNNTDNEIGVKLARAARNVKAKGHEPARRIVQREHYKLLYERNPLDVMTNPEAAQCVFQAACKEFGETAVKGDAYREEEGVSDFPVLAVDGRIASSLGMSQVLRQLPVVAVDYVFIRPDLREKAIGWLSKNREDVIRPKGEEQ